MLVTQRSSEVVDVVMFRVRVWTACTHTLGQSRVCPSPAVVSHSSFLRCAGHTVAGKNPKEGHNVEVQCRSCTCAHLPSCKALFTPERQKGLFARKAVALGTGRRV